MSLLVGYTIVTIMNTVQTLLVDLNPSQGSSVTACVRLIFRFISWIPLLIGFRTEQPCPMLIWSCLCLSN